MAEMTPETYAFCDVMMDGTQPVEADKECPYFRGLELSSDPLYATKLSALRSLQGNAPLSSN